MERIVYRKTLDVHKNGIQFTLQGFETADNMARTIEISLMASGDAIDLPLEQMSAIMYVRTPTATEPSINECTIKDNTIACDVLPIVEEGITEVQLKLIETNPEGARGVLVTPKFAIEVSKSNTDDESVTQTTTYTALENALAKAKGVYDARIIRIEIDRDCTFRIIYADGTMYETDALKETLLKGEAILSQSYARGGTGTRAGEDTDNSMYYSGVSRSASAEAQRVSDESVILLQEMTKHGVYTAFSLDFTTGELEYISPLYSFSIDTETGELNAEGETYNADETVDKVVSDWLEGKSAEISASLEQMDMKTSELKNDIVTLGGDVETLKNDVEAFELRTSSEIEGLFGNVGGLQSGLSYCLEKATKLETDTNDLKSGLQGLTTQVSDNKSDTENALAETYDKIASLESASESANAEITKLKSETSALSDTTSGLADREYIIEQGVDTGWTYKKYASGRFEAWIYTFDEGVSTVTLGNVYRSDNQGIRYRLPDFVKTADYLASNCAYVTQTSWSSAHFLTNNETLLVGYTVFTHSAVSQENGQIRVWLEIKGTWK